MSIDVYRYVSICWPSVDGASRKLTARIAAVLNECDVHPIHSGRDRHDDQSINRSCSMVSNRSRNALGANRVMRATSREKCA